MTAKGNKIQGTGTSSEGSGGVVSSLGKRSYRNPPTLPENSRFRREPGHPGRTPVCHEYLDIARSRLRKFRKNRRPVDLCWNRLRKFPQEVLFLTMAGYSSSYICRVFSEELPNLYKMLSVKGVESSMEWVMKQAREGELRLEVELQEVLSHYEGGPWAEDAEHWMKAAYLGKPVKVTPDVVPAAPVDVVAEVVKGPETVAPVAVVAPVSVLERTKTFADLWNVFRGLDPGLGDPTPAEIIRGFSVTADVVYAERVAARLVTPVVQPVAVVAPEVDVVTPAVEPAVVPPVVEEVVEEVPDRFTDAELVPMHRAACKFFGKRPDLKAAEFARCRQIGYFEALMEFEHRDTFADFEWEVTPEGVFTRLGVEEAKPDEILGSHRERKEETLENSLISQGVSEEADFSAESGKSASEEVVSGVLVTSEEVPVVEAVLEPEVCDLEVRGESFDLLLKRELVPVTTKDVRTFVPIMEGESYEEKFSNWQNYQGPTDGMNLFTCDRGRLEMLPNMGVTFEEVYGRRTPNLYVISLMFEEILEQMYGLDTRTVTSSGRRVQHYANVWNRETALEMAPFYLNDWFLPLNPMRVESRRPRTKEEVPVGYTWVPFMGLMETSVVDDCNERMLRGGKFEYESTKIKPLHKRFAKCVHQACLGGGASNVSRLDYAGVSDLGASIQFPLGLYPMDISNLDHPDLAVSSVWKRSGCPRADAAVEILSKIRTHIVPGDLHRFCSRAHMELSDAFFKRLQKQFR